MKKAIFILASLLMTSQVFSQVVAKYDCGKPMGYKIDLTVTQTSDATNPYEAVYNTTGISHTAFVFVAKTINLKGKLSKDNNGNEYYSLTAIETPSLEVQAPLKAVGENAKVKEIVTESGSKPSKKTLSCKVVE